MRMVSKYNKDPSVAGIELIIADCDSNCLRLIEYVNKRHIQPETQKHPIISLILLMPELVDQEIVDSVATLGGANAVFSPPFSTKTIFNSCLETLYHRKLVDGTFKDLRQNISVTKYPFIPVFVVPRDEDDANNPNDISIQDSVDSFMEAEKEEVVVDDFTNCSSLLPRETHEIRKLERGKLETAVDEFETKEERTTREWKERFHVDQTLLHNLAGIATKRGHDAGATSTGELTSLQDDLDKSVCVCGFL